MDHKLTKAIKAYLGAPAAERDTIAGATLLLKLNRNKVLYANIVRRPAKYADKLAYELQKHYQMRLDKKTVHDVVVMTREAMPRVSNLVEKPTLGKRADHDQLPEQIQQLWDNNNALFLKVKQLHVTLKGMMSAPACDRYEYLKQMVELEGKYRANLDQYDHFDPLLDAETEPTVNDVAKEINAARAYLSRYKSKLESLKEDADQEPYSALLLKMQERYDTLVRLNAEIADDTLTEFQTLGLRV